MESDAARAPNCLPSALRKVGGEQDNSIKSSSEPAPTEPEKTLSAIEIDELTADDKDEDVELCFRN